jgi:hypothetical protein
VGKKDWDQKVRRKITMRRYLYIYVAAALLAPPAVFGQDNQPAAVPEQQQQPNPEPGATSPGGPIVLHPAESPVSESPGSPQVAEPDQQPEPPPETTVPKPRRPGPQLGHRPVSRRKIPLSQYSPLAAAGGYSHGDMSPWQAIVNYFNPRHLNLNQIWEERRQAWLDNAANNMYFWAIYWGSLLLIISMLCNGWQYDEQRRVSWAMSQDLADALHYAAYCQLLARNAIARYNKHVEKCNRVFEARLSGMMTPETAKLDTLKRRIDQLTADNTALQFEKASLSQELQQKTFALNSLGQRVAEAEEKFQKARNASPNAEMVERVNRLEKENQQLKQQKAANGSKPLQKPTPQDNV